jgi:hypothetical protein
VPAFEAELSLSTVCGGMLEEEFQALYPLLLNSLREDKDKASISITIDIQRVPETTSMVKLAYRIKPVYPGKAKASVCQISGNKLMTEKPRKMEQLKLFQGGAKVE